MGWFGPRGIASIALLFVAISEEPDLPGMETIETTVVATVLLSIVLHGVSAAPLVARYADWAKGGPGPTDGSCAHPRRRAGGP